MRFKEKMERDMKLCIKGYSVMKEYWKNKTETKKAIDKDGWMRTGDLVLMRDDGYLEIVGNYRKDVQKSCDNLGVDYALFDTGEPLDAVLTRYLVFRKKHTRKGRVG